jgi:hypothetical protein
MSSLTEQVAAVVQGEVEGMLVVGLAGDGEVCGVGLNPRHRALSFVKVWELAALAEELEASALVVVLAPDGPARAPTPHEIDAFVDLCARAHRAQVVLSDCLVVRGGRTWSLRELAVPLSS